MADSTFNPSSSTFIITPTDPLATENTITTTASSRPQQQHYSVQQLRALTSRLDLLKAGSLLLLPSVLPYLASALTALTSTTSSTNCLHQQQQYNGDNFGAERVSIEATTTSSGAIGGAYWWVTPLLPCVGLVLPMAMATLSAAAARRRKSGSAGCCRMKARSNGSTTATGCPYTRLLSRLGLDRRCAVATSTEEGLLLPIETPSSEAIKTNHNQRTVSFTVYSSLDGSFDDTIITTSCPLGPAPSAVPSGTQEQEAKSLRGAEAVEEMDSGLTSKAWVDVSDSVMDARVASADNDDVMDSEWEFPPEQSLQSMTAEQRESLSALRDFWDAMEEVVGDEQETDEIRREFEEQLREQQQEENELYQHHKDDNGIDNDNGESTTTTITQEELVQGMEEKMMDERDRTDVSRQGKIFEYVPVWTEWMLFGISLAIGGVLVALSQARAHTLDLLQSARHSQKRFCDEDDDESEEYEHLNDYNNDTDTESLSEKGKSASSSSSSSSSPPSSSTMANKPRIIPRAVNRLVLLMALVANFWVVHSEFWDIPALLFVALGSGAVLLTHAWVPKDI
ncbi:hypothetical protein BGX29_000937 [Mortierella sp. GBA35]|nr:hypothetical protein BGX29_000937 [Mortierella sp. GBA35]